MYVEWAWKVRGKHDCGEAAKRSCDQSMWNVASDMGAGFFSELLWSIASMMICEA